jgi:SEC-C motif-containing protein
MSYESCCEPLHREKQRAATAEQLMRSRYSAFVLAEVNYLIATHPDSSTPLLQRRKELSKNCREARWLGLKIKAVEAGGVGDLEGTVRFEATFGAGGQRNVMSETSLFQRRDGNVKGNWLYIKPL